MLLTAAFLIHVWRHYEIRAFSDPLNWLRFARDFATQIHTTKYALGFALFLRGALALTGPYCIFLINLPILLGTYLLAAALVQRSFTPRERVPHWQVASLTLTLFFLFDRWLIVYLMNPYRDPLSFLLSLAAALFLVVHAQTGGARPARAALAGLLLGLSCSVRETSVLFLPPFALYAFWSWRADRRIHFWRDGIFFSIGLLAGIAPLMWQGWLRAGQPLLPAQSTVDNKLVPGMHFTRQCFQATGKDAWLYLKRVAPPGVFIVLWAAVAGLWRRNRVVAGLLIPAALIHAVFYCFYWTFVARYFYSAVTFAVPAAAWGLLTALRWCETRLPSRHGGKIASAAIGALVLLTALPMLIARPAAPRFQIPQARKFARDFGAHLPKGGTVFARRNLCEMLEWFIPANSFPAMALIPGDVPAEPALQEALAPYLESSAPLHLVAMHTPPAWELDAAMLQRLTGLDEIRSFSSHAYNLYRMTGVNRFQLFAVRRYQPDPPILPGMREARANWARYDFAINAVPNAAELLSGDTAPPTAARLAPGVLSSARASLPGPVAAGETLHVEIRLRSIQQERGVRDITATLGASSRQLRLRQNRLWQTFTLSAEGLRENPELELSAAAPFEFHRVDWSLPQPTDHLVIDVGSDGDFAHLLDGWHGRETAPGNATVRWSGPSAAVSWLCAGPGQPGQLVLRHYAASRPPLDAAPRLWCNDLELRPAVAPDGDTGYEIITATIPPDCLRPRNIIRFEIPGWQPGAHDPRQLGLYVDWIELSAGPPSDGN
ncbi:MAG: hypothetical protein GX803_02790 [Lentisphaerae bacterium]|nr:hypothetical protein [Lentisphaerota bacterium]